MDDSAIADSPPPAASSSSRRIPSVDQAFRDLDVEGFDWKAFEGTYKGRALITRLLHIPKLLLARPATTDPRLLEFARTALIRAIPHIKKTWDHSLYLRTIAQINETLGRPGQINKLAISDDTNESGAEEAEEEEDEPMADSIGDLTGDEAEGVPDRAWVQRVKEEEKKEVTKTDVELRGYMSNLIKESIRLTHLSFARMAVQSGKFGEVIKHNAAAREFASSPLHHIEQGLGVIDFFIPVLNYQACLVFNHMNPLPGVLGKVEAAVERVYQPPASSRTAAGANLTANDVRENRERDAKAADSRKDIMQTLRVAKALLALEQGQFSKAGSELAEMLEEGGLGAKEGEAISTSDVALITAMCVLATGRRNTIRDVLLSRSSFRSAVDDTQQWILDIVRLFADAQYGEVKVLIKQYTPVFMLNPFLSSHIQSLIESINTRAIVQYIQPFSTVSLETMASATGIEEESLLLEIEGLLEKGQIKGRIDLIDKILQIKESDPRDEAYKSAFRVGGNVNASTRAAIIRMRLQEAKIEVDARGSVPTARETGLGPTDSTDLDLDLDQPDYLASQEVQPVQ